MKNYRTTRKALKNLAAAVAITAATFGLTCASALATTGGYYVAYRTPSGYLTCTEPYPTEKAALYAFEKALFGNILGGH